MKTSNDRNTESTIDRQIETAKSPDAMKEPKRHTQSIYWWLRKELGFSHMAAVVATHAAVTNDPDWSICFKPIKTLAEAVPERMAFEEKKADFEAFAKTLQETHDHLSDVGDEPSEDIQALLAAMFGGLAGATDNVVDDASETRRRDQF